VLYKIVHRITVIRKTLKYLALSIAITTSIGILSVHQGWSSFSYFYMAGYLLYLSVLMFFIHICLVVIATTEI
jgi:hypothetical protein